MYFGWQMIIGFGCGYWGFNFFREREREREVFPIKTSKDQIPPPSTKKKKSVMKNKDIGERIKLRGPTYYLWFLTLVKFELIAKQIIYSSLVFFFLVKQV